MKLKNITSKMILSDKYLHIDLGNLVPETKVGKLNPITFSIYIGKATSYTKENLNDYFNDYFKNGFLLKIDQIICDTFEFENWIDIMKEYPKNTTFIAIYKDKDFPMKDFERFKRKLFTVLGKNTKLYISYFDLKSKTYFSYRKIKP